MNLREVPSASLEQLTAAYRRAASAHGQATSAADHKAANRHHDVVAAVYRELRARGLPAQEALLPLLQDSDDAVRIWAASHALEFAPDRGESVLTDLEAGRGPSAFDVKMTLREWRKGTLAFP